ncbi:hypothetical protein GGX14DRAFT_662149 [Mycena pura]|uniref:Uncharacterized protein n=1 Tax=Mycena pura TaxID=153505 RepID=A0AAD6YAD3_9AGAR|nr:hypothetical protein GGX14DRAFT_662149 [Mycena pura]
MRAASKLEQAHPFSPHARRKTTSSPIVKPLLPLNMMPFPNINDPASTSALNVEDEYLNSAAKMADPSTMVSTFSPCCIWRDGDELKEAPARSAQRASTTRARPPPHHMPAARAAAWCQCGSGRDAGARARGLNRTARARAACTVISVSMSSVWLIRELFGWGQRWGNSQRYEKVDYQDWSPRGAPSMVINRRNTI